jgi:hypothetical protein
MILLVLAASTAPAEGADLGFEHYLKHQHNQTVILPRLYEPVPKHISAVSNEEVLHLWNTTGSPILRDAEVEKQLYQAVVAWRNEDPAKFDRNHHTVGQLLSDRQFFDYAMYLYHLDTARFVHYHHHLVPFLRGMALTLMEKPVQGQGTAPPTGEGETPMVSPAPEGETDTPTPPNSPTPPQTLLVPEPSSIVPMALGIGILGAAIWARRRLGRAGQDRTKNAIPLPDRL